MDRTLAQSDQHGDLLKTNLHQIPLSATIAGLSIGTAVLFHEGSTLLVVFNALRLLAFAEDDAAGAT